MGAVNGNLNWDEGGDSLDVVVWFQVTTACCPVCMARDGWLVAGVGGGWCVWVVGGECS